MALVVKKAVASSVKKEKLPFRFGNISFGMDPEFFFAKGNDVIGAEKVFKKTGLSTGYGKFIIDGVQAELNPTPNTCRANMGNTIRTCFQKLKAEIQKDPDLAVNFDQTIKLTKKEMASLSKEAKIFGCDPSTNVHSGKEHVVTIKNPDTFRTRVAGGHIHLGRYADYMGTESFTRKVNAALAKPERTVLMLDMILGNTCVLIDKDDMAKERRKLYGKAGDYRRPSHGLEYRTLSNFWLKSYQLMGLVLGLARTAVLVVANSIEKEDEDNWEKRFLKRVSMRNIRKAINENNFKLALKNFEKIEDLLVEISGGGDAGYYGSSSYPINRETLAPFKFFIKQSLDYWFPKDPLEHWANLPEGHGIGWESFMNQIVTPRMKLSRRGLKLIGIEAETIKSNMKTFGW